MVRVVGGGPAGTAAALAALGEGQAVEIYEPHPATRQKACGDFLAPGALAELDRLGVLPECEAARPARIDRVIVHVGACERQIRLRQTAWGFSRGRLEQILLKRAIALGARLIPERRAPVEGDVSAIGRTAEPGLGHSAGLCAFQAHFTDPAERPAEIFFLPCGCVGFTPIEERMVTVCGLVDAGRMREHGSQPDDFLARQALPPARLERMRRRSDWVTSSVFRGEPPESGDWPQTGPYPAGDALVVAEAFTGTGILNALITGRMAGVAAARGTTVREYSRRVQKLFAWRLLHGYAIATALDTGWARILAPVAPVGWLFRLAQTAASE